MQKLLLRMKVVKDIMDAIEKNELTALTYEVEKAASFRDSVRAEIKDYDIDLGRVKMAAKGSELVVFVKTISRAEQLERLVRKLMLHVDDEKLYNEALEVLNG